MDASAASFVLASLAAVSAASVSERNNSVKATRRARDSSEISDDAADSSGQEEVRENPTVNQDLASSEMLLSSSQLLNDSSTSLFDGGGGQGSLGYDQAGDGLNHHGTTVLLSPNGLENKIKGGFATLMDMHRKLSSSGQERAAESQEPVGSRTCPLLEKWPLLAAAGLELSHSGGLWRHEHQQAQVPSSLIIGV